MKKILALLSAFVLTLSLSGCSKGGSETIFDAIKLSSTAKMELPDGSFMYVDSKISSDKLCQGYFRK